MGLDRGLARKPERQFTSTLPCQTGVLEDYPRDQPNDSSPSSRTERALHHRTAVSSGAGRGSIWRIRAPRETCLEQSASLHRVLHRKIGQVSEIFSRAGEIFRIFFSFLRAAPLESRPRADYIVTSGSTSRNRAGNLECRRKLPEFSNNSDAVLEPEPSSRLFYIGPRHRKSALEPERAILPVSPAPGPRHRESPLGSLSSEETPVWSRFIPSLGGRKVLVPDSPPGVTFSSRILHPGQCKIISYLSGDRFSSSCHQFHLILSSYLLISSISSYPRKTKDVKTTQFSRYFRPATLEPPPLEPHPPVKCPNLPTKKGESSARHLQFNIPGMKPIYPSVGSGFHL